MMYLKKVFSLVFTFLTLSALCSCSGKRYKATDGELIFSSMSDIMVDNRLAGVIVEEPITIENTCWNTTDFDYQNAGISMKSYPKIDADEYRKIFSKNNKYDFYFHPIMCDGMVYNIDSSTANITAYKLNDGKVKKLWKQSVLSFKERSNTITANARLDNNVLYISTNNGYVIAFDINTKKVLWKTKFNVFFNASPTIYNDALYLISSQDEVFAINKTNGEILWKFSDEKNDRISSMQIPPVAVYEDKLVIGLSNGKLLVLDRNGKIVWKQTIYPARNDGEEITDIDFPPILFNGILVAGGIKTSVMGFDFKTGMPLWQIPTGLNSYMLFNNQGFGFFVSKDNENICFVINNGLIKWIRPQEKFEHTKVAGYFNNGNIDKVRTVVRYFDSY